MSRARDQPAVLYVDDEEPNRVTFEHTFNRRFPILCAHDGQSALDRLGSENVGVVVADQRMPGMSGNELLGEVRSRWPHVIRIILTGYSDLDAILGAVNHGLVARYIVKPWSENDLGDVLEWALRAHALAKHAGGDALQLRLLETERLATLGAVQASFVHELGTPLSYVSGNIEVLRTLAEHSSRLAEMVAESDELPAGARDEIAEILSDLPWLYEDLRVGCSLMRSLRDDVNRLLHRAPESESYQDGEQAMRAIDFAMAITRAAGRRARCEIEYQGPTGLPPLRLGQPELMQILINLLHNAIQAQAAVDRNDPIIVSAEARDTTLDVTIIDRGVGMSEADLSRVGKQFYTTKEDGTGLGVHKSRSIIERAGGSLRYASRVGEGTRAILSVPIAS